MRLLRLLLLGFAVLSIAPVALAMDVGVKVSSFKVDLTMTYAPGKIMDGDPTTAWAGGSISSGEGQWVEFSFGAPVHISRMGIYNGHQGPGQFEKFRRIRSGRVVYPDGAEFPFWLRDEQGEQFIDCPPRDPVKSIRIVVDKVFPEGVPLARMKLAVSEVKLYLTLMKMPPENMRAEAGDGAVAFVPPPVDTQHPVPEEIKALLRSFYVKQARLDPKYHLLFAPHVRDRFDFQFEVFKEMQRQRGTYKILRTAEVDPSGLGFELVYLNKDVAEVRVYGTYRIKVADLDENMEEDSVFAVLKGDEGWKILELEGQEKGF